MRHMPIAFLALIAASPAFAATKEPASQPAPAQGIQKVEKKDAPLRLREPLMLDDRRHQLAPPGRLPGTNKPMPKNGSGPEIG
jgi:hypothetical protein